MRIVAATPPHAPWPDDLRVLFTQKNDLMPQYNLQRPLETKLAHLASHMLIDGSERDLIEMDSLKLGMSAVYRRTDYTGRVNMDTAASEIAAPIVRMGV